MPPVASRPQGPAAEPDAADTDPSLHLWVVLARAFRAIQDHAAADAARHDLTLAEFGILEALWHKGRLLLGELGQTILVSSGWITFLVDRLESRGLVAREECEEDRRARYAVLTREGERLVQRVFPEHAARLQEVLGGLDDAAKRQVAAQLKQLGLHAAKLPPLETPGRTGRKRTRSRG